MRVTFENCHLLEVIMPNVKELESALPVAPLKLVAMQSAEALGRRINDYLVEYRRNIHHSLKSDPAFHGYTESSYLCNAECPRFGSGEGKGVFYESVRGKDLYILLDVCNHSITYQVNGYINHMSPDDHYQDLKRIISAAAGKAHRINVIMPFLYEGRQHKRSGRESLDCAIALEELYRMGVSNIVTFDAHDPRVQNAAPLAGFDNFSSHYQFLRALLKNIPDLIIDKDHTVVISPDEGGLSRAVYFAGVLGVDTGMFYKRRDYSTIIGGRNPIVAHEFLGDNIDGKDVFVIDDMIASGESILETAQQLKEMNAKRVFLCTTFGLFTRGLEKFDYAYEHCYFDRTVVTNLCYLPPQIRNKPYFLEADMSKFLASIIDFSNHDSSLGNVMTPTEKIHTILKRYNLREEVKL